MTAEPDSEKCSHCSSTNVRRLVSRFARVRSEDDRVEEFADEMDIIGEPESSARMRGMVREMGKAMDDDIADEMEEVFEADMEGKLEDEA